MSKPTGTKEFKVQHNIGKAKYCVSYHDGVKQHEDGSKFFDLEIFRNKKKLAKFTKDLLAAGYVED